MGNEKCPPSLMDLVISTRDLGESVLVVLGLLESGVWGW